MLCIWNVFCCILLEIKLLLLLLLRINNIPALVQIMDRCRPSDWSVLVQAIGWVPSGTAHHVLCRHMVSLAHNESNRCCAENSAQLWYHKTTEAVASESISKQFTVPANYPQNKGNPCVDPGGKMYGNECDSQWIPLRIASVIFLHSSWITH